MASKADQADHKRPHVVCVPFPFQSHIKSMLKLAKLLHHKGSFITFVNTDHTHSRLLKSRGPVSLDGLPDFQFKSIPDGIPRSSDDEPQALVLVHEALRNNLLAPFRDLITNLNDTASSNYMPPVTCIISDGFNYPFAMTASEELGIPIALFFTISACSFMGFQQYRALKERGLTSIPDESSENKNIVNWVVPGMKDICLRDLPRIVVKTDQEECLFNYIMESTESAFKAYAVILHSFDALEQEVLNALFSMFSHLYPIGPLQLLLNHVPDRDLKYIGCNLWKEEPECLQWLDSRKPNSVVYANFGSVVNMTKQQLYEFGSGLVKSNYPFLWIIRPDFVTGDSATLPPEFIEVTKETGFFASWCPQEEVLNHPSIGSFITHSGWGSTIESISSGVPMLCWPVVVDQRTNCRYTCKEWGIGVEIDGNLKSDNIEKLVRELMEGEKGKKMKKKAMEWKILAEEATSLSGSSSMNLEKFVKEMLLP